MSVATYAARYPVLPGTSEWDRPLGAVADRPWWRVERGSIYRPSRPGCLGAEVYVEAPGTVRGRVIGEHPVGPMFKSLDAAMTYMDDAYPMPHPGHRIGQIWWNARTGLYADGLAGHAVFGPGPYAVKPTVFESDGWMLLVDPLRPSLAPWAPFNHPSK